MVSLRRHKTSKRHSLRHKHKIEGKVREHNRRLRKEGKKMKALGLAKKKPKQVFKIPNLYPFKKELIEDLERKKKSKELEKKIAVLRENDMTGVSELDLERDAEAEEEKYTNALLAKNERAGDGFLRDAKQSMKAQGRQYVRELKKVLEAADIILEVLDARDPMACRNRELEAEILGMPGDKKIILVLNKIDLVPQNVANAWLNVLRREFATVLFKANTQEQGNNLGQVPLYKASLTKRNELVDELLQSSKAVGADSLLQLIKNYSKTDGVKGAVTVGLIGYPNVGKSSIINSLKRNKSVSVSSTPGHTKAMQEISLDAKVKLLDCPGVVLAGNLTEAECVLRNIIKVENVVDPIGPVEAILRVVNKVDLLTLYRIGDFNDINEFLSNIALARGKFTKGGVGDLEKAAKVVLHDWAEGRIKYFTSPPEDEIQQNIMSNLMEKPIELE